MNVSTALTTAVTMWHHGDIGTGWWILMMIGMVLWWGLLIAGAVWLVRAASGGKLGGRRRTPHDILDERLASGEIDVEEYERRVAVLERRIEAYEHVTDPGHVPGPPAGVGPPSTA